jgi:hypothetical protein
MGPMYVRQDRLAQASTVSIALFVDAGYVRRCAARSHQMISGSPISASRVSIDAGQISRFLDSLIVDFELGRSRGRGGRRPGRRIYDTIGADRRQRWRQLHYRSVLRAEAFVLRTVRALWRAGKPGRFADASNRCDVVEAALADDLMRLGGELGTAVLLAGGEQAASAVRAAREQGTEVLLLVPAGCGALVADGLRDAATRVIGLHPEVFEALFDVRQARRWRADARGSGRPASAGAGC